MISARIRDERKLIPVVFVVFGLAGCVSPPNAPCTSGGEYPLPATLCNSFSIEDVTSSIPPAPPTLQASGHAAASGAEKRPGAAGRDPTARLTVHDVLRRVIQTNPDVGIAAAKEKEQYAAVDAAHAGMLPTLDLTAAAGPQRNWLTDPAGNAIRREVGLSLRQNRYDFGAAKSNYERASLA